MTILPFSWWFYSHSILILQMALLPICPHSADDSTSILLMILLPFYPHSTDNSTHILLMILLPIYWWFYSHSTDDSIPMAAKHCSTFKACNMAFFSATHLLKFNNTICISTFELYRQIKGSVMFELFTHSLYVPLSWHQSQAVFAP